jgi:tetratricopeptide (TPR) repeat protein
MAAHLGDVPARERDVSAYEVRGILLPPPGVSFNSQRAYVQLGNPIGQPLAGTEADSKGRFRFKHVPVGMYVLTAYVPRVARTRRTVDIGPSLAAAKGYIDVTLPMEPASRRAGMHQVTVDQLSIPEEARSELEKGLDRFRSRDLAGAAQCFRRAVDAAPDFGTAWHQLGTIAYFQGNFKEAAAHFQEASKCLPQNFQVLIHLGAALLALRDGSAALGVNARAVKERPNDAQAQAQLGFSLFLLERLDEAEIHLKKAVELDPANFFFPQLHLAEIYRRRKDHNAMARELEQFLGLHPDAPVAGRIRSILDALRARMRTAESVAP